jgi:hypothetical protein
MRKIKENRVKWLNIRVSQKEYDLLQGWVQKTTCRKVSQLARNILFRRPLRVYYRNESADDFLQVALELVKELSSIGNNLNQAVKGLHSFRTDRELSVHLFNLEMQGKVIHERMVEIRTQFHDIYVLLAEDPKTQKSHVISPILPDSNQTAAADQQENKAEP